MVQQNGTDMTLKDVPWDASPSSTRPIGGRGIYWLNVNPNWGLMVDYHHAKIYSELGATVNVSGKRDGVPITGKGRINNTFDVLEFTDGLNQIFFGGMYRWKHPRWTPYVGLGVGFAFPHVEVKRTGATYRTFQYEVTGCGGRGVGWP